jgi:hypothetical protein
MPTINEIHRYLFGPSLNVSLEKVHGLQNHSFESGLLEIPILFFGLALSMTLDRKYWPSQFHNHTLPSITVQIEVT